MRVCVICQRTPTENVADADLQVLHKTLQECNKMLCLSDVTRDSFFQQVIWEDWQGCQLMYS